MQHLKQWRLPDILHWNLNHFVVLKDVSASHIVIVDPGFGERRVAMAEAAKSSGVFWKSEREFLRQARAWSLDGLDAVQPELLAADRACKQTGSPDQLIAERLALTIAGRARRLGL